jgi:hypothetical protein
MRRPGTEAVAAGTIRAVSRPGSRTGEAVLRRLLQASGPAALAGTVTLLLASCAAPGTPPAAPTPAPPVTAPPRTGAPPVTGPNAPVSGAPAQPAAVANETATRPSLGLFSHIKAPADLDPAFELTASGVQIFRCEPDKDGHHWAFRLPEAELRDSKGQIVGRHGAQYSFEHLDGSRLLGSIVGYDSASSDGAVPWLLLQTRSYGQGDFERITYVQRVDTQGGMPPKQCGAEQSNQVLRVPFSAKFVFYRPH